MLARGERVRDLVDALVAGNPLMAANEVPADVAGPRRGGGEGLPEVAVHDVRAPGRPPPASPPGVDPLPDAADDVRRIGVDGNRIRRRRDVPEPLYRGRQLHPVVGGVTRAAAQL